MANVLDINQTKTWIAGFEKYFQPDNFLRKTFFGEVIPFITESVIMDYRKGTKKMAPFVVPGNTAVSARSSFQTREYTPPFISLKRPLNVRDIKTRSFGENPLQPKSEADRAKEIRVRDYKELHDMIERRFEWMCAQLLINGSFEVKGVADDGDDAVVIKDTVTLPGFTNKKTAAAADQWTKDTADVWGQIEQVRIDMSKGDNAPTMAIMNSNTAKVFMNNKSVKEKLNIPNSMIAELITARPKTTGKNITHYAFIKPGDIEVVGYDAEYEDEKKDTHSFIPDGYVVFASPGIGQILSGAITQLVGGEYTTFSGLFVPKEWADEGTDTKNVRLASRAVPLVEDIDSFYSLKVF